MIDSGTPGSARQAVANPAQREFGAIVDRADEKLLELSRSMEKKAEQSELQAAQVYQRSKWLTTALILAALLVASIFAWLTAVSIRRPLEDMRASVESIAESRFDTAVPHTDYANEIGDMARSVRILQDGARNREMQRWIKQGLAEIDEVLLAASSFEEFGDALSARLASMLGLVYGAFYVVDSGEARLRRVGGYGCDDSVHARVFAFGQGLVGQAALARRSSSLSLPAGETVSVTTGLGQLQVRELTVCPIVEHDKVLGVLEIGALEAFDSRKAAFIEELIPEVATRLQILLGNVATRTLLEQTQQAEEKLRLANFLGDQALDLTRAGYWHVPLDDSGWYNSSERAAKVYGDPPNEGWRYRVMEEWFVNVQAGRQGGIGENPGELHGGGRGAHPRIRLDLCVQAAGRRAHRLDPRAGQGGEGRDRQAHGHVWRGARRHGEQAGRGRNPRPRKRWPRTRPGRRATSSPT